MSHYKRVKIVDWSLNLHASSLINNTVQIAIKGKDLSITNSTLKNSGEWYLIKNNGFVSSGWKISFFGEDLGYI